MRKYFQLVAAFEPDGKASGVSSFNSPNWRD